MAYVDPRNAVEMETNYSPSIWDQGISALSNDINGLSAPSTTPSAPTPTGGVFDPSLYGTSKTVQGASSRPQSMHNPWGTPTTKRTSSLSYTGSGGGGGVQYKRPTGQVSTTTPVKPGIPMPTLGAAPQFNLPARDEARVRRLQQEAAAPGVRSLRRQTRLALMRQHYDDPRARENIRAALAGHGEALSQIMGMARTQGRREYAEERGEQIMTAQANFMNEVTRWKANYQAALNDYMAQYGTKQVTKKTYGDMSMPKTSRDIFFGYSGGASYSVPKIWS